MKVKAKLFINGRSQSVRLPKEFRFKGTEVVIHKEGNAVILEPVEKTEWPNNFWKHFNTDNDFEIPISLPVEDISLED